MDVLIRKAKSKDIGFIYNLFLEMVKSEDYSSRKVGVFLMDLRNKRTDFSKSAKKELLREIRERNAQYLIAESDGKIVGYVRGKIIENSDPFFKTCRIGYLSALVVLRKYNGRGIATQLKRSIENWFKFNKCSQIQLDVFENNPAIRIYEKWGYKTFNRKMVKPLK